MKLTDKTYNILKWLVITVSPALATLITGLGLLYRFDSSIIVGTITLITTFVGALIGISSSNYNKANAEKNTSNDENGDD